MNSPRLPSPEQALWGWDELSPQGSGHLLAQFTSSHAFPGVWVKLINKIVDGDIFCHTKIFILLESNISFSLYFMSSERFGI